MRSVATDWYSRSIWDGPGNVLLSVHDLNVYLGRSHVLHDFSFDLTDKEVLALVGRNGAGKTTTLRSIMGLVPAASGSVIFNGTDLLRLPPHTIPRLGIGYTPQGRGIFPDLTVAENLRVAVVATRRVDVVPKEVLDLFPMLVERDKQRAGTLSGGEQQMLAIARALATQPAALLMDEPSEGLMPVLVAKLAQAIGQIRASGVGVLLAEQRLDFALDVADRILVVESGQVRYTATAAQVRANEEPLLRFLGVRRQA